MPSTKSVLLVGGGGQKPPSDGPALPSSAESIKSPAGLKQALDTMISEAAEIGCEVRVIQLPNLDLQQQAIWAQEVRTVLASQKWDGFIIGNGIRGTPSLTILFEQLINMAREVAPHTQLGFNTHPLDVIDVLRRMFPETG